MALTKGIDPGASPTMPAPAPQSNAAKAHRDRVRVRGATVGEGPAIAALWRELWDAHQAWGGYPGSRDEGVYARLAGRLDEDARVRSGWPILGNHAHLVADLGAAPCGQVEGWLERRGPGPRAPLLCEVRSLIVGGRVRGAGVGRALLDALAGTAQAVAPAAPCLLAAEVLEPNPAHGFYARVGFTPVAWSTCVDPAEGALRGGTSGGLVARMAGPLDASAISTLEAILAERRRAAGDLRFEPPRAIDGALLTAVAAHLAADAREQRDTATIVAVDRAGAVRGAASVMVQTLDPPFLPVRRSLIGRFALDTDCPPLALLGPLVALGCRFAAERGALRVELTDLSGPESDLYDAALALGAKPWSRVVLRQLPVPCPLPPHG
jgi:GNAT superfamily N-acetyltransferase